MGQEGQFAQVPQGLRGLINEDFWHFDCMKCSEMHFKPVKGRDRKTFMLASFEKSLDILVLGPRKALSGPDEEH